MDLIDVNTANVGGIGGLLAIGMGLLIVLLIIAIPIVLLVIISYWKIFKKAGKPGWAAIIPFYSTWVECEVAGCHWLVFLLSILGSVFTVKTGDASTSFNIVAVLSFIASIMIAINLAKKFNKSNGFVVGLILLPVVFLPILAFSKNAVYDENAEVKNCGFFDVNF